MGSNDLENPEMICANFYQLSAIIPKNCYNCAMRNGYPLYLFGDDNCVNFQPFPPKGQKSL